MADALSSEVVLYVARLARLELSEDELHMFKDQLSAILDHAQSVCSRDLSDVEPMVGAITLTNVMRADVVRPGCDRDEVLAAAPDAVDGRFKVPRILGEAP